MDRINHPTFNGNFNGESDEAVDFWAAYLEVSIGVSPVIIPVIIVGVSLRKTIQLLAIPHDSGNLHLENTWVGGFIGSL